MGFDDLRCEIFLTSIHEISKDEKQIMCTILLAFNIKRSIKSKSDFLYTYLYTFHQCPLLIK